MLGVTLYASPRGTDQSTLVVSKLLSGLMGIVGKSLDLQSTNCISAVKLYKSIVL